MDLHPPPGATDRLIQHLEILAAWNRTHNLTAVRNRKDMITKHLIDSLSISKFVKGNQIIDIGSGAGFPGIPVAIVQPHREFVLVDAKAKKTQFLRHVVRKLALENVSVVESRIEQFAVHEMFDSVLVRALGSLNAIAELAFPLLAPGGAVLAMKGRYPDKEIKQLKVKCSLSVQVLNVPYLNAERHLISMRHK